MSRSPSAVAPEDHPDAPWQVALRRLQWRARRGMLENDLVLGRYFRAHASTLDEARVLALESLLDLPDGQLLDLVLGREQLSEDLQNSSPYVQLVLNDLRTV
jgi:antitoxin CptB